MVDCNQISLQQWIFPSRAINANGDLARHGRTISSDFQRASNGKFPSFVGIRHCRLDTWGRFLGFPDDPGKGGSRWEQGLLDVAIYQRMVSIKQPKEALDFNEANFQTVCWPQMHVLQVLRFCDRTAREKIYILLAVLGALWAFLGPSSWTLLA